MKNDFSINQLSKLTGRDRRTIDKRLVNLKPCRTVGKTRYYAAADVLPILGESPKDLPAKQQIEIRLLRARCERVELETKIRKGQFLPIGDIKRECTRFNFAIKQKFHAMPRRISQQIAAETDASTIETKIESELNDILTAMSERKYFEPGGICENCGQDREAVPEAKIDN